ncbi:hypothetical protein EJD97_013116 [Solanum chilense]|uniref:Dirigent protein n=1 Tax=Solanum chilense TaxID=4083 RepID=A0A6N2BBQ3_SOLCI|nr:hypothetical protein EJD97_013116 [Solanum chilense]
MMIIPPPKNKTTGFGQMNMIDNALTIGPKLSFKIVGRVHGKYNGSTFTILDRNSMFQMVREMAVIRGSGLFRFARGYVQASTHLWDFITGDATVQYDVYVLL